MATNFETKKRVGLHQNDGWRDLIVERWFTTPGTHPFDEIEWERRDARIIGAKGEVVFEQKDVEIPKFWSQNATNIVASKYFRGQLGTPQRESTVQQLIGRVVRTITGWGLKDGYFASEDEAETFAAELTHLLVHQKAAFNSPCFVPGTPVMTEGGFWKPIEQVRIGDLVVTHRGRLRPVTQVYKRWVEEPAVRLNAVGLPKGKVTATLNHPFLSLRAGDALCPQQRERVCGAYLGRDCAYCGRGRTSAVEPHWVLAQDLKVGDYIVEAVDLETVKDMDVMKISDLIPEPERYVAEGKIWSQSFRKIGLSQQSSFSWPGSSKSMRDDIPVGPDLLRFIGYYLAGGDCHTNRGGVRLSFGHDDPTVVEDALRIGSSLFGLHARVEGRRNGIPTVCFHSKILAKFLHTVCGTGAKGKTIPSWMMGLPPEQQRHLLLGIFRGDGHQSRGKTQCLILRLQNETLVTQAFVLLRRQGLHPTLEGGRTARPLTPQGGSYGKGVHTISVHPRETRSLCSAIFGAEYAEKEGWFPKGALRVGTHDLRKISSISYVDYTGFVYNLEVEEDHSYAVNGLAAHNCWFNVGVDPQPQCSACFILSLEDAMESILDWYKTEGLIFKGGSGSGVNLSRLRSSKERLSSGGMASGPVSFMRGADAIAGTIKSGGKTRRAAKMIVLNVDHPDIEEFIWCKAKEERKAYTLAEAGYDLSLDGEAWISIQYQNANNSVRVTDDFMRAVLEDKDWRLRAVTTGEVLKTVKARDLMRQIAEAAWQCADPGMQCDTTINDWHTTPSCGPITASNPCAEYHSNDDTSCNLSSVNLLKLLNQGGEFDVEAFRHAVATMILAQEIIIGNASYPTEKIRQNTLNLRQLGLGYTNLGAFIMACGLPYDSDEGRALAGAITALMTGHAYATSALIAKKVGPFAGFEENREPMRRVMRKHREALAKIDGKPVPSDLYAASSQAWDEAVRFGELYGYRNAQATVLAPTGTISFMMDCDTTGIEPDLALVKCKSLVGGGVMRIINQTVPLALKCLGYAPDQIEAIAKYIDEKGTIEGAPFLQPEHLPVFDCAFRPSNGTRFIHYMGHVRMLASVQPFISGAISKTVNVPHDVTVDEVMDIYIGGWRMGLKALAIYRDSSKKVQPLSTAKGEKERREEPRPIRKRLPGERQAITYKFSVGGQEGYITVGLFEDGTPGEVFLTIAKEGSTVSGLMDIIATETSIALQYGVPLKDLVRKFINTRFEPAGITNNLQIRFATSIIDYVFRWLGLKFLPYEDQVELGLHPRGAQEEAQVPLPAQAGPQPLPLAAPAVESTPSDGRAAAPQLDGPSCFECGAIMVRAGSCHACLNCGATRGCS